MCTAHDDNQHTSHCDSALCACGLPRQCAPGAKRPRDRGRSRVSECGGNTHELVAAARTSTLPATHTGNRAKDVQEPVFADVKPRRRMYSAATASSAPAACRKPSIGGREVTFDFDFFSHGCPNADDDPCIHNALGSRASVLHDLRISGTFACPPGERPPLNLSKSTASSHVFRHRFCRSFAGPTGFIGKRAGSCVQALQMHAPGVFWMAAPPLANTYANGFKRSRRRQLQPKGASRCRLVHMPRLLWPLYFMIRYRYP
jgi:hypothetical protein